MYIGPCCWSDVVIQGAGRRINSSLFWGMKFGFAGGVDHSINAVAVFYTPTT